jgi:hypothetical protein
MTRINVVDPAELSGKHLVAEYRELPRVFTLIQRAIERGERPDDPRNPREYTLGKGHVRFFYDKTHWLIARFHSLVEEMQRRGYQPTYTSCPPFAYVMPIDRWGYYAVTDEALRINRERIKEREKH